jgi:hypothetical protein
MLLDGLKRSVKLLNFLPSGQAHVRALLLVGNFILHLMNRTHELRA